MFIPIGDDNSRVRAFPVANTTIIAFNVVVFLFVALRGGLLAVMPAAAYWPDRGIGLGVVSHQFLHDGFFHIAGNMLFLYIFGDNVEDRIGSARYVAVYLVMGVVAALAHAAITRTPDVPLVGASGAVSGVMGMYLVLFPTNKIKVF